MFYYAQVKHDFSKIISSQKMYLYNYDQISGPYEIELFCRGYEITLLDKRNAQR